jgi:hypothetical protein
MAPSPHSVRCGCGPRRDGLTFHPVSRIPAQESGKPSDVYESRLDVHGSEAAFNEDGVDLSQIRESLAMTPLERLYRVQNWVNSLAQVRVVRGPR